MKKIVPLIMLAVVIAAGCSSSLSDKERAEVQKIAKDIANKVVDSSLTNYSVNIKNQIESVRDTILKEMGKPPVITQPAKDTANRPATTKPTTSKPGRTKPTTSKELNDILRRLEALENSDKKQSAEIKRLSDWYNQYH